MRSVEELQQERRGAIRREKSMRNQIKDLNDRIAKLKAVRAAAQEIQWCDACGNNYFDLYDALIEALKEAK